MVCSCRAKLFHRDGSSCPKEHDSVRLFQQRIDSTILSVIFEEQMHDFIDYQAKRKKRLVPNYRMNSAKKKQSEVAGAEHWFEFKEILEIIESNTSRLSSQQREIMDSFAAQSVAHIVGHENFQANPLYFTELAHITHVYPFTNCVATRRFGKSKVMSLFAAVCVLAAPSVRITIFSTGLRASVALLDDTKAYLAGYPPAKKFITMNNTRMLELTMGPRDIRRVQGLAGGISGNKGVGGKILILEELTQIKMDYYMEVILPLITVALTTILAITTPKGEDNAHTREFLRQKNNKDKIFNILEFSLVCDRCKERGESIECQHNMHKLPPWKSQLRQRLLKKLMSDVPKMYEQEGLGNPGEYTDRCFTAANIEAIATNPPVTSHNTLQHKLFLSIDLTGGRQSNFAIASFRILTDSRVVVSRAEQRQCRTPRRRTVTRPGRRGRRCP